MIKETSKDTARLVKKELVRRALDTTQATASVMGATVYLYGRVKPLMGREAEFETEIVALQKSLLTLPDIRTVVAEWEKPGGDLKKKK